MTGMKAEKHAVGGMIRIGCMGHRHGKVPRGGCRKLMAYGIRGWMPAGSAKGLLL